MSNESKPNLVVLDGYALNPGDLSWSDFESIAHVTVHERTPLEQVSERVADADLVLTNKTPLRAPVLDRLSRLRYIGVLATGYDVIDLEAASRRGICVTNVPTYGTHSVAQLTFALLLELCHHVGMHSDGVRAGEWSRNPDWTYHRTPLIELAEQTLGILGFGRIGREVAGIGNALGMKILACDESQVNPPDYPGFRWGALEQLLRESDVVSLHSPLVPETRGIINAQTLGWMKPGAFLINTARGALVIEQDLADALNAGRIAGAALDVLPVEPPAPDNPLIHAKNCIVTPHLAWATRQARSRLMRIAFENLESFLRGKLQNVVTS